MGRQPGAEGEIDDPGYPDLSNFLSDDDTEIHDTQPELRTHQEQDPEINSGETLDIPDVHSDPDTGQQPRHQHDSDFKKPSQSDLSESTRTQKDHPGSTPEVKILSATGIIPTDELHVKKNRGRPPKVKMNNTARVASEDRHTDKGIPLRSPQVMMNFHHNQR